MILIELSKLDELDNISDIHLNELLSLINDAEFVICTDGVIDLNKKETKSGND